MVAGCKTENKEQKNEEEHHTEIAHHSEEITLTKTQIENASVKYGTFKEQEIKVPVIANGTIELPPNNKATISPLLDGFITAINVLEGDVVKKGQTLAALRDPDYITLQQDYLSTRGRMEFLKQEVERQKILDEAEVGAKKSLQQALAEYTAKTSELNALKEQLGFLGINIAALEQGKIQSTIYLKAPFSGTVTSVSAHNGQHVLGGQEIMQVINREHMHLELQLFQKDIPKVKKGQSVAFTIPAFDDSPVFNATVSLVGKNLNEQSKTIRIHAHFKEDDILIPGLYVEAKVMQLVKAKQVLPLTAVIQDKGDYYVYIKSEENESSTSFKKVKVQTGLQSDSFIVITNTDKNLENTPIVIQGAAVIKAESNKSEGGHGH